MIIGLVSIILVFVLVLILLKFGKVSINPAIASEIDSVLSKYGFTKIENANLTKEVKEVLKITKYPHTVDKIYQNHDGVIICWLSDYDNNNNHLALAIRQDIKTPAFIFVSLKKIGENVGKILTKFISVALFTKFSKMDLDSRYDDYSISLYVEKDKGSLPIAIKLYELAPKMESVTIRSSGSLMLIELMNFFRNVSFEQEVNSLLNINTLIKQELFR